MQFICEDTFDQHVWEVLHISFFINFSSSHIVNPLSPSINVRAPVMESDVKVRPHGQQFSHTTLYNKVVWHKTCRGYAKSCRATNLHTSTIFLKINLARLQRKNDKNMFKLCQIAHNIFVRPLCRTNFFWNGPTFSGSRSWSLDMVAQHKMSHDTCRPYRPHYHNHNTFYVAQPCCTKSYD